MKNWRRHLPIFLLVLLFLINSFVWFALFHEERGGLLTVSFLDVGQGDAIFIEAPNGRQLLLDAGADTAVMRQLGAMMPFYDRSIDVIVATHADKDHVGGFPTVLERFTVAYVIEGGTIASTAVYNAFSERTDKESAQRLILRAGDRIILDARRGVELFVLFPDRDASEFETNTGSLVARLTYGDICFLLTGDSPKAIEEYLTELYGEYLGCDVLKVGHHGSRTSSSPDFVQAVSPAYAVISAGKDNSYGHPHQEVLDIFNEFNVEILRTDELGAITFETDGINLWRK